MKKGEYERSAKCLPALTFCFRLSPVFRFSLSRQAGVLFLLFFSAPLFARMPDAVSGEEPRDYFQFLFLYESTYTPGQKEFMIHPLYGRYRNDERAYKHSGVLYPVYYSAGTNYWNYRTFLYLFTFENKYHEDEKRDDEYLLAPLFYWGSGDTEKEQYFSIFPFYGTIKDKLAWSEISFVMFPLYSSWSYKDYKARSLLWPLIMWGGTPEDENGFKKRSDLRIFPFYSSKVHSGKYNHKTVLWPFFQWGSDDLDKKDPRHFYFFFPFYAQKRSESGTMQSYSILWPFTLFAWGFDERRNTTEYRALWFLFQNMKSGDPHIRKLVIFPFYAHYRFGDKEEKYYNEMNFYLILLGNLRTKSAIVESSYDFFIPFYYRHHRYYPQEREEVWQWKLWPLASGYRQSDGANGWRVLALWPLPDDYLERTWGPLYSLAEWRRESNDDVYFSLLFRFFSVYLGEDSSRYFFAGFHYTNSPYLFEVGFLGGLIGYSRETQLVDGTPLRFYPGLYNQGRPETAEDRRYLHLFWMRF